MPSNKAEPAPENEMRDRLRDFLAARKGSGPVRGGLKPTKLLPSNSLKRPRPIADLNDPSHSKISKTVNAPKVRSDDRGTPNSAVNTCISQVTSTGSSLIPLTEYRLRHKLLMDRVRRDQEFKPLIPDPLQPLTLLPAERIVERRAIASTLVPLVQTILNDLRCRMETLETFHEQVISRHEPVIQDDQHFREITVSLRAVRERLRECQDSLCSFDELQQLTSNLHSALSCLESRFVTVDAANNLLILNAIQ